MGLLAVGVTGPGLVIDRWAEATIVVVGDAVVFAVFGSGSLPLTVAVLVMVPAVAGAVALMVNVALAPEARLPTEQVTVPAVFVHPVLAETKATPLGRVSVTVTPGAGGGAGVGGQPGGGRGVMGGAGAGPGLVDGRSGGGATGVESAAR